MVTSLRASRRRSLGQRTAAFVLIVAGLVALIWVEGPAFGSLMWGALLSVAALLVVYVVNQRITWLTPLAGLVLTAD
jgi:hypothetical protein